MPGAGRRAKRGDMTALESDPGHLRHMPKLDGLRALAIGLVLLHILVVVRQTFGPVGHFWTLALIAARWVPEVATAPGPLRAGIYVAASLAIAEVSWRFREQPIRRTEPA
jgi:peptidoglycan/LPS O-acetylase OafA/YrhL